MIQLLFLDLFYNVAYNKATNDAFYIISISSKIKPCRLNCNKRGKMLLMRRKNITSKMMKEYIIEATLLLMKKHNFSEISIGEIANKAGVNRSTYYRNFHSKEEIIETFFYNILEQIITELPADDNLALQEYLAYVFKIFYRYKDDILCIHQNQLSHLLLSALNSYFLISADMINESFIDRLPLYYHTGGIFNNFILWFDCNMEPVPEIFAEIAAKICLPNAKPVLLQHKNFTTSPVRP